MSAMLDAPLLVTSIIEHAARWHATTPVVARLGDGTISRQTYVQIADDARRLANLLVNLGVRAGDVVTTVGVNSPAHLATFYAAPGIGAICHTLNPRLPRSQLQFILEEANPAVIICDAAFMDVLEGALPSVISPKILLMDSLLTDALSEDPTFHWPVLDERSPAMLCYTSGSTGTPKGVSYTHRSLTLQTVTMATPAALGIGPTDCVLPIVPMYHVGAWGVPYCAPAMGAKLVLPGKQLDGASLAELILDENVTISMAVPTVWEAILDELDRRQQYGILRGANVGGAPLTSTLRDRLSSHGIDPLPGWGMTETSAVLGLARPSYACRAPEASQGKPVFGVDVRIVDDKGVTLDHDGSSVGELEVRGHWVTARYHMDCGQDAFTDDGWLRTGDLAKIDPNGYVRLVDRLKDLIKSGGEWISPSDIEDAALSCDGIDEAVAVAIPDPRWTERPFLFVRGTLDEAVLRVHLGNFLARWQIPDKFLLHAEPFPTGATGKVSRIALRALAVSLVSDGDDMQQP